MTTPLLAALPRTTYAMAGLRIVSEVTLTELVPWPSPDHGSLAHTLEHTATVDIRFRQVSALPCWPAFDGTPIFETTVRGAQLVIPELASVVVRGDGSGLDVEALPGDRDDAILLSHLLVDHAIPRLLVTRGETVLHATCVAEHDHAIAFLGATGTGKSTMALGFCRDGAALVADDCLVVRTDGNDVVALPSYPSGRLREDSADTLFGESAVTFSEAASGKRRVTLIGASGPVRLGGIVLLDRQASCEGPISHRLRASEALWALAGHSFLAAGAPASDVVAARVTLTFAMASMRWLAESVPVVRLTYPSDLTTLPSVRDHIRATALFPSTSSPRRNGEVNT